MTVADLKYYLEGLDDDTQVRFAAQPNWPFEYSISDATLVTVDRNDHKPTDVLYLGEGRQIGYLPGEAKEELGWC